MSERRNDDIAKALHGLASGEHVEPDPHEDQGTGQAHHLDHLTHPQPPGPTPAPPPPPASPLAPQFRAGPKPQPNPSPPAASPAAPKSSRPAAPGSGPQSVPLMRPRPQPQPQPPGQRPAAPSAPVPAANPSPSRPASPVAPARANVPGPPGARAPAAPIRPNLTPPSTVDRTAGAGNAGGYVADENETTNVQPVDEDDVVIVPAAPLSALGHRGHLGPAPKRVPMFKTLQFRRTAIPVLLTSGLVLLAVVGLRFVVHHDSVLATLPAGTCLALVATGALLLLVAALNMAQVRQQLNADKPRAAAGGGSAGGAGVP